MVIVLALAFSLSAIVTIYTLFRSGNTAVPDVVGRPEPEALKLDEEAGLRVKIQRRSDSTINPNLVIETRPGPNSSVKKDSVLTIVVSSGPIQTKSQVVVPGRASPGRRHQLRSFIVDAAKGFIDPLRRVKQ